MVTTALLALAAVFGLAVGSFLNVVIHRVPRDESLLRPGSHCPRCGTAVRNRHNVPVFGWLLLRGRCADCAAPIWSAAQISVDQRNFLAGLPSELRVEIDGLGQTLFCHGSPRGDDDIITPGTAETRLDDVLRNVEERVIVVGHTHMQFDRRHGSSRLINPGSVGLPYEGRPGAYWAFLGPDVDLRRTEYDFTAAAQSILDSGYPEAEQHVRDLFREQPGPDVVTAFFEGLQEKRPFSPRDHRRE